MKTCSKCGEEKSASEFHFINKKIGTARSSQCKACRNSVRLLWSKNNVERNRKKNRDCYIPNEARSFAGNIRIYGLTPEKYDEMFRRQNGGCAVCGGQNLNGKRLFVDHDHETKMVRGLLCGLCNCLLGYAKDRIDVLHRAADYLESPIKVAGGYL